MPPRKKKKKLPSVQEDNNILPESKIRCRTTLQSREEKIISDELETKTDRLNSTEKKALLDAYNDHGYYVFQDVELLKQYLPNRSGNDLKSLIKRLCDKSEVKCDTNLDKWQEMSQLLVRNFSKNKVINLDSIHANVLDQINKGTSMNQGPTTSNSFDSVIMLDAIKQLLMGKFPEKMDAINALVLMKLFEQLNDLVDSIDLGSLETLADGSWLNVAEATRDKDREDASEMIINLKSLDSKNVTRNDFDENPKLRALFRSLPKIERATDTMNPFHITSDLMSNVLEQLVGHPFDTFR